MKQGSSSVISNSSVESSVISSSVVTVDEFSYLKDRISEPTEYLYDNFKNGVSPEKWFISKGNWSSAVSNGQIPSNVGYTKEGILVLKANGMYYPNEETKLTGAALVSKETLGPGKYEVAMQVMPRLGACTAFWTFYYESDNYNHEIDIELPGNKSYEYILNTNWVGVGSKEHTSKTVELPSPVNDGKWHKYTFEWHTEPAVVNYYVDDVLTATTTTHVPTANGQLWIGVWFPNRWAGVPDFETDYLLVDWISYRPYNEHSILTNPNTRQMASLDEYPTSPITLKTRNYISNPSFENDNNAWNLHDENAYIMENSALDDKRSLIVYANSYASQTISAVYKDFTFYLSFLANLQKGDKGEVRIVCLNENNEEIISSLLVLDVNVAMEYITTYTTVENTKSLKISFHSVDNSIMLVDKVYLTLLNS